MLSTPNVISFLILVAFFVGRYLLKKNLKAHMYTMSAVVIADFGLVIYLVVAQQALSKVNMGMHYMLFIHIPFAIFTLVLYGFAVNYAVHLVKGQKQYLDRIRHVDKWLVVVRPMTFITSAMLDLLR